MDAGSYPASVGGSIKEANMQTVYIVEAGFDYEGSAVESVHSTREGAEKAKEKIELSVSSHFYDFIAITEYTLQD